MLFLTFIFSLTLLFSPEVVSAKISTTVEPYEGYTLIAPNNGGNGAGGKNEISLVDLEGEVVHSWLLDTAETQFAKLEQDGTLLVILGGTPRPATNPRNQAQARIVEIDWDGNITWEYQNNNLHHDFARLANGNIVGIVREPLSVAHRSEISGETLPTTVWVDRLIEIDYSTKQIVWQWGEQDELDLSQYPYGGGEEIFHTNAVSYLPVGNAFNGKESLMISLRDQSAVIIIDKKSGDVVWGFSDGVLEEQHDSTLLENGNVLVFNNRPSKATSQVLEIDPEDNSIVWKYEADGFFAEKISGAQRLPNGNTLITEGTTGSIFEVSAEGDVVWKYDVVGNTKGSNSVFRSYRYGTQDIDWPDPSLSSSEVDLGEPSSPSIWKQYPLVPIVGLVMLVCLVGEIVFFRIRSKSKSRDR